MTRSKRKGQMFLIAAIIIASSLIILKLVSRSPVVMEETKILKVTYEASIFSNLINELNKTMDFSFYEGINITRNVFNFGNFSKRKMAEHSLDLKIVFVGSLANSSISFINVTVINLFGANINVTLTLNDSQSNTSMVANYGRWDTNFTITPGNDYILTVSYDSIANNVTIETKSNKDVYVGFFDVFLKSSEAVHRSKYQKSLTLK